MRVDLGWSKPGGFEALRGACGCYLLICWRLRITLVAKDCRCMACGKHDCACPPDEAAGDMWYCRECGKGVTMADMVADKHANVWCQEHKP